jgi:hypothetical protein
MPHFRKNKSDMLTVAPSRLIFIPTLALLLIAVAIGITVLIPKVPLETTPSLSAVNTLPLAFVPNQGQFAPEVQMQVQGRGSTLHFLQNEVLIGVSDDAHVRLQWEGANQSPTMTGTDRLLGVANVMRGSDARQWQTDIPMYGGASYTNLYPGIDLHYDGSEGTLKGTYIVAAGAAASQIRWQFLGAETLALTPNGDLEITLPNGAHMTEEAPVSWQTIDGEQVAVPTQYGIDGTTLYFVFPQGYNPAYALTIDPTLLYSTYIGGGASDETHGVTVDNNGNIYLFGETFSEDLLGQSTPATGSSDLFIAKLNPAGTQVLYLSIIGSEGGDYARDVKTDSQGNAYISVYTLDDNFPTVNALWSSPGLSDTSALVKFNSSGSVVYSTYLPLRVNDATQNLAVDSAGNAHVTGIFVGAVDPQGNFLGDQVGLLKLSPNGQELVMGVHIGAEEENSDERGVAVALDPAGNAYIAGIQDDGDADNVFGTPNAHQPICGDVAAGSTFCGGDGFIYVVSSGGELTYASYHGGGALDMPVAIAADGQGNVLIAGTTTSPDFPIANALQTTCPIYTGTGNCNQARGFVSMIKIQPTQSTMTYSTYWGAPERDSNNQITAAVMDSDGNAYVTGWTNGRQFPLQDPIQEDLYESFCSTFGSERYCFDSFVSKFTPTGQLAFSTFFGALFDEFPFDIALDNDDNILFVGLTEANNFPTTANALQPNNLIGDDGFFVKIGQGSSTPPTVTPGGPTVTVTAPPITPIPNAKRLFLPYIARE